MGVEIKDSGVSESEFAAMREFVRDYLVASIENEEDGGRMRWYPWHSAEYRFNHILNVVDLGTEIAAEENADVDVVRVAALFHDVAKLEADQDVHADAGARIAREYLRSHNDFHESFVERVCDAVSSHSYQGDLSDLPLETQCLIEADLLDKVGANGTVLMLLRMGYESRSHMDAATMLDRILERGENAVERIESDAGESIAHQRLKRVRWFQEWILGEVPKMDVESDTSLESGP